MTFQRQTVTDDLSATTLTASPCDTGVRCHPRSWIPYGQSVTEATPAKSFGRVDFDDDGATVCVAYIERGPSGWHTVHLVPMGAADELHV